MNLAVEVMDMNTSHGRLRYRRRREWENSNSAIWSSFLPLALAAAVLFSAVNLSIQLSNVRATVADGSAHNISVTD
jgi:hypothetical protein